MTGKRKVKLKTILDAIPGSGGIVSTIADSMGVSWATARKALDENPEAFQAFEAEQEKRLDLAESVVIMNIQMAARQQKKGYFADTSDAKWYLSKKGKKREYGENSQVDLTNSDGTLKSGEIGVRLIDYRIGITETETGSSADHTPSSKDKNPGDGQTLG